MAAPGSLLLAPSTGEVTEPITTSVLPAELLVVTDVGYCAPGQITLKVTEKIASLSGDDFKITDPQTGAVWFKMDAKLLSLRDSCVLVDAAGRPACGLKQKLVALKPTWNIYKGGDFERKVAIVKQKLLTLKPEVLVYLTPDGGDGDKEVDYYCKGNFRAKNFTVYRKHGGQDHVVAQISRESRFSSTKAFMKAMLTEANTYFLTVAPGADVAFMVGLLCTVDKLFHDKE